MRIRNGRQTKLLALGVTAPLAALATPTLAAGEHAITAHTQIADRTTVCHPVDPRFDFTGPNSARASANLNDIVSCSASLPFDMAVVLFNHANDPLVSTGSYISQSWQVDVYTSPGMSTNPKECDGADIHTWADANGHVAQTSNTPGHFCP
jgi:hypothetical protein